MENEEKTYKEYQMEYEMLARSRVVTKFVKKKCHGCGKFFIPESLGKRFCDTCWEADNTGLFFDTPDDNIKPAEPL